MPIWGKLPPWETTDHLFAFNDIDGWQECAYAWIHYGGNWRIVYGPDRTPAGPHYPPSTVTSDKTTLHIPGNGSFDDVSGAGNVITSYGAVIDTTEHKFGSGCVDTRLGYLQCPISRSLRLYNKDFTVSFWFKFDGTAGYQTSADLLTMGDANYDPYRSVSVYWDAITYGGVLVFALGVNASGVVPVPDDGQWHHFALTRWGGIVRGFLDGIMFAAIEGSAPTYNSPATDCELLTSTNTTISIGWGPFTPTAYFAGFIDDFVFVNGEAFWNRSFGVPDTEYSGSSSGFNPEVLVGVAHFDNSALNPDYPTGSRLSFDTNLTWEGGSGTNDPIDTSIKYAGAGSLNGDRPMFALKGGIDTYSLMGGDFCISLKVRFKANVNDPDIVTGIMDYGGICWIPTNEGQALVLYTYGIMVPDPVDPGVLPDIYEARIRMIDSYQILIDEKWERTPETWIDVKVTRNGNTISLFMGGSFVGETLDYPYDVDGPHGIWSNNGILLAGQLISWADNITDSCWVDEFKAAKGTDTPTFALPTTSTDPTVLLHGSSAPFADSSAVAHSVVSCGAVLETTIKKFGAGSIDCSAGGLYVKADSMIDGADGLEFGTRDYTLDFWMYAKSGYSGNEYLVSMSNSIGWSYSQGWSPIMLWRVGEWLALWHGRGWQAIQVIPQDEWAHIAIVRQANNVHLYMNGAHYGVYWADTSLLRRHVCFGGYLDPGVFYPPQRWPNFTTTIDNFQGYMQEIRLVIGSALHTGLTFPVPSGPY